MIISYIGEGLMTAIAELEDYCDCPFSEPQASTMLKIIYSYEKRFESDLYKAYNFDSAVFATPEGNLAYIAASRNTRYRVGIYVKPNGKISTRLSYIWLGEGNKLNWKKVHNVVQ